MSEPVTPVEVFDLIREKAMTAVQTTFMESGKAWPEDDGTVVFVRTMVGIGVAMASEHYSQNPEHLAIAGQPFCTVCREPIQTLQIGVDVAPNEDAPMVKRAWPCGHLQGD